MSGPAKFFLFLFVLLGIATSALWIIGGRPLNLQSEIRILAGPDLVFEWLVDPEKRTRWVSDLKQASVSENDESGRPVLYQAQYEHDGRPTELVESVQQFDPAKFFSLRSVSGGVRRMQVFRLEQEGNAVRVTYESIETARSFGKILFAISSFREESGIIKDLETLKRLVEKDRSVPFLFGEPVPKTPDSDSTNPGQDQSGEAGDSGEG
jgi:hypothetical protein